MLVGRVAEPRELDPAAGDGVGLRHRGAGRASALLQELPWTYLGLTYALFRVVPLLLFARLAFLQPTMWSAFGLAMLSLLVESVRSFRYRYE